MAGCGFLECVVVHLFEAEISRFELIGEVAGSGSKSVIVYPTNPPRIDPLSAWQVIYLPILLVKASQVVTAETDVFARRGTVVLPLAEMLDHWKRIVHIWDLTGDATTAAMVPRVQHWANKLSPNKQQLRIWTQALRKIILWNC